jgi:Macrocin-O-methyltransferase (TylF)
VGDRLLDMDVSETGVANPRQQFERLPMRLAGVGRSGKKAERPRMRRVGLQGLLPYRSSLSRIRFRAVAHHTQRRSFTNPTLSQSAGALLHLVADQEVRQLLAIGHRSVWNVFSRRSGVGLIRRRRRIGDPIDLALSAGPEWRPENAAAWEKAMSARERKLYLDLLMKTLTNVIYEDQPCSPGHGKFDMRLRSTGHDWPSLAHSMAGLARLENVCTLAQRAIDENIPGDFIESGVWRGGCCILMRGVLAANAVEDRGASQRLRRRAGRLAKRGALGHIRGHGEVAERLKAAVC